MRDMIHDRIDRREELTAKATELVRSIVTKNLGSALDEAGDFEKALDLLVQDVAVELDPLTTEAVRAGVAHARTRAKMAKRGVKEGE